MRHVQGLPQTKALTDEEIAAEIGDQRGANKPDAIRPEQPARTDL